MLVVILLIDVQYSQKAVLSFERGSNCQNCSSSLLRFSLPGKKFPSAKFPIPPTGHSNLEMEAECLTKTLSYLNLNITRTKIGRNKL